MIPCSVACPVTDRSRSVRFRYPGAIWVTKAADKSLVPLLGFARSNETARDDGILLLLLSRVRAAMARAIRRQGARLEALPAYPALVEPLGHLGRTDLPLELLQQDLVLGDRRRPTCLRWPQLIQALLVPLQRRSDQLGCVEEHRRLLPELVAYADFDELVQASLGETQMSVVVPASELVQDRAARVVR